MYVEDVGHDGPPAEAHARSPVRRLQLPGLGDRSDPDRPPVRRGRTIARSSAFCAAALAFGRVASVLQSIERLLAIMGDRPAAYVRQFDPRRDARRVRGARPPLDPRSAISSRWSGSSGRCSIASGSIEGFFLEGYDPAAADIDGGARQLFDAGAGARSHAPPTAASPRSGPGVCYFFPRPSAGSACKRLNLFLRWMVRRDALDLGVWTRVSPAQLVVPLDTHVIRVGRCLRLTRYTSPGWAMARDITASLRALDPRRSGEVRLLALPPRA